MALMSKFTIMGPVIQKICIRGLQCTEGGGTGVEFELLHTLALEKNVDMLVYCKTLV